MAPYVKVPVPSNLFTFVRGVVEALHVEGGILEDLGTDPNTHLSVAFPDGEGGARFVELLVFIDGETLGYTPFVRVMGSGEDFENPEELARFLAQRALAESAAKRLGALGD